MCTIWRSRWNQTAIKVKGVNFFKTLLCIVGTYFLNVRVYVKYNGPRSISLILKFTVIEIFEVEKLHFDKKSFEIWNSKFHLENSEKVEFFHAKNLLQPEIWSSNFQIDESKIVLTFLKSIKKCSLSEEDRNLFSLWVVASSYNRLHLLYISESRFKV